MKIKISDGIIVGATTLCACLAFISVIGWLISSVDLSPRVYSTERERKSVFIKCIQYSNESAQAITACTDASLAMYPLEVNHEPSNL